MVDKIDTCLLCIKLVLKILWFLPIIHNSSGRMAHFECEDVMHIQYFGQNKNSICVEK